MPGEKPRFYYIESAGALVCDVAIASAQPISPEDGYWPDGPMCGETRLYFVAESMGRGTAKMIAEALGGELG